MLAVIILLHKAGHEYKGGNEQGLVWTLQMCLLGVRGLCFDV